LFVSGVDLFALDALMATWCQRFDGGGYVDGLIDELPCYCPHCTVRWVQHACCDDEICLRLAGTIAGIPIRKKTSSMEEKQASLYLDSQVEIFIQYQDEL
jgi:hypothetical protein